MIFYNFTNIDHFNYKLNNTELNKNLNNIRYLVKKYILLMILIMVIN